MPIRVHIDKDQPFVRRRLRESAAEMLHHFRRRIGVFGAVTIRPSQQADNAAHLCFHPIFFSCLRHRRKFTVLGRRIRFVFQLQFDACPASNN